MGEAEIAGIARKLLRQVAIGQPLVIALASPRAEVDLIDRHRRAERVDIGGRRPGARQPCPARKNGGRLRAPLAGETPRAGFLWRGRSLWVRHYSYFYVPRV